jgi:hypothetical protein
MALPGYCAPGDIWILERKDRVSLEEQTLHDAWKVDIGH